MITVKQQTVFAKDGSAAMLECEVSEMGGGLKMEWDFQGFLCEFICCSTQT